MKKVLLVGYYGKGNFGDDVLFKVTYNFVRQWQPNAEINVLCDEYKEHYLPKLIEEDIRIIEPGNREHFDVIIHGGGGTLFDFKEYGFMDYMINTFIKVIGFSNYQKLESLIRNMTNKKNISSTKRYGFGIGVGTYTKSSKKLKYNIPTLLDFDSLAVRDTLSIENLQKLGLGKNIQLGSDLAFLDHFWIPKNIKTPSPAQGKKRIGLILRDWDSNDDGNYLNTIDMMLKTLSEKYEFSFFVLDKRSDKEVINISSNYTTYIWDPMNIKFTDYCETLANQDLVITSRAHGAICGAILGVPSILIEIEPKLKTIHSLLPNATSLIDLESMNLEKIIEKIENLSRSERASLILDVTKNKALIQKVINDTLVSYE